MPATAAPRAQSVKVNGVVSEVECAALGLERSGAEPVVDRLLHGRRVGEGGDVLAAEHDAGRLERAGERGDDVPEGPGRVVEQAGGGLVAAGPGPDEVVQGDRVLGGR